jgi:hypothetical protein
VRKFIIFLVTFLLINLAAALVLPQHFPHQYILERDPAIDPQYQQKIEEQQPQIIVIGNSIVQSGVDAKLLTSLTGEKSMTLEFAGAFTPVWYLLIKNSVLPAQHHPAVIVIVFRDTHLTQPDLGVHGQAYEDLIDSLAGADEELFNQLAYFNEMSPLTRLVMRDVPLYKYGREVRTELDEKLKYSTVYRTFGIPPELLDKISYRTLRNEESDRGLLGQTSMAAETNYPDYVYNFQQQLPKSFLPPIIDLTEGTDIRLVFVRVRRLAQARGVPESQALQRYIQDLTAYLNSRQVTFLDFSHDGRFTEDYYGVGEHFNARGEKLFTEMLAEALIPVFSEGN